MIDNHKIGLIRAVEITWQNLSEKERYRNREILRNYILEKQCGNFQTYVYVHLCVYIMMHVPVLSEYGNNLESIEKIF